MDIEDQENNLFLGSASTCCLRFLRVYLLKEVENGRFWIGWHQKHGEIDEAFQDSHKVNRDMATIETISRLLSERGA